MASLWVCQTVWRNDASWVRNLLLSVSSFSHCNSTRTDPSMPLFIFQFVTPCTIPLIDISFQPHLLSPHTIPCFVWALFVVFFVKRKKNKPTEFELFKPLCVSLGFVELSRHLWHRPSLDVDQTRIDSLEGWESCPVSETLTWNNGGFPKQKPWDFF